MNRTILGFKSGLRWSIIYFQSGTCGSPASGTDQSKMFSICLIEVSFMIQFFNRISNFHCFIIFSNHNHNQQSQIFRISFVLPSSLYYMLIVWDAKWMWHCILKLWSMELGVDNGWVSVASLWTTNRWYISLTLHTPAGEHSAALFYTHVHLSCGQRTRCSVHRPLSKLIVSLSIVQIVFIQ